MEDLNLLVQFHLPAKRQGPGGDAETLRAIKLAGLSRHQKLKIADLGCGTGASTLTLAKELDAEITAIDLFPEFLTVLENTVRSRNLLSQITVKSLSMEALPFSPEELDVIWSEGAIYNMGFQRGVSDWRKYLRKGGVLAVSEITWLTQTRPHELESYWNEAYPEVATASEKIKILEKADYKLLGYFAVPVTSWEENYYQPMEDRFEDFLNSQNRSEAAEELVQNERAEIELFRKYNHYFGYGFYIAEKL